MNVKEEQANRFRYLELAWQGTKGDTAALIDRRLFEKQLGLDDLTSRRVRHYLTEEGLLKQRTLGHFSITHQGVKEMEAAHSDPDEPTDHFPSLNTINVYINGTVTNSSIQVAGDNATQTATVYAGNKEELGKHLASLLTEVQASKLPADDLAEVVADITTMQAQLAAKAPKRSILTEAWTSVRNILESATAGVVTDAALKLIPVIALLL